MCDVVVIGAGPAGSVASIRLARGGMRVTLIEQHRFPRDKVCGECISALGAEVLDRCAAGHLINEATELSMAELHDPSGRSARLMLPAPMRGISRACLDEALLEHARQAGVHIWQPARCEKLDPTGRLALTTRHLVTNAVEVLSPGRVILADGKAALLQHRPAPSGDFGLKAHFRNVAADDRTVHLYALAGHYTGLAPIEDGLWNMAMSIPREKLQASVNADQLLSRLLHENAALDGAMRKARRVSDWIASPLPRFAVRHDWPEGIIPIGNAAAALEPIGGEGMGLALRSAELAANALLSPNFDPVLLQREFGRLWNLRRVACRAAAWWISHPALCSAAVEMLETSESLRTALLALIGKSAARSAAPAL